jgi:hypothetical protein
MLPAERPSCALRTGEAVWWKLALLASPDVSVASRGLLEAPSGPRPSAEGAPSTQAPPGEKRRGSGQPAGFCCAWSPGSTHRGS